MVVIYSVREIEDHTFYQLVNIAIAAATLWSPEVGHRYTFSYIKFRMKVLYRKADYKTSSFNALHALWYSERCLVAVIEQETRLHQLGQTTCNTIKSCKAHAYTCMMTEKQQ